MSERASARSAECACSGAMYSAVPIIAPDTVRFAEAPLDGASLRDAEVDELEQRASPPGTSHEDVLGLEIAVDDAERVRSLERVEHLRACTRTPTGAGGVRSAIEHRRERLAL